VESRASMQCQVSVEIQAVLMSRASMDNLVSMENRASAKHLPSKEPVVKQRQWSRVNKRIVNCLVTTSSKHQQRDHNQLLGQHEQHIQRTSGTTTGGRLIQCGQIIREQDVWSEMEPVTCGTCHVVISTCGMIF